MKIKDYKLFLESNNKEDIDSICQKYDIRNYTINDDGSIDVNDDVYLSNERLDKLPLKFGKVTGSFECDNNLLTSLEGGPKWVGGNFTCGGNKLKTLDGCPNHVGDYFDCYGNQLTTLEGGPKVVLGEYYCSNNQLVNFKGFPEDFEHNIYIKDNPVSKLLIDIPRNKENKFIYWCNEYDAITDNGEVIPERMEEVYNQIGLNYLLTEDEN